MLCRAVDSHNSYVWTSRIFIFCARKIQKSMQIDIDPLGTLPSFGGYLAWDESDGAAESYMCGTQSYSTQGVL